MLFFVGLGTGILIVLSGVILGFAFLSQSWLNEDYLD